VRQFRRVQEAVEMSREARRQANRRLTSSYDHDGSLVINARLPAEVGAIVSSALEAAISDFPLPALGNGVSAETSAEDRPSNAARRADAPGVLAESFLKHGPEALNGGERHHIVVHVDAESLHAREAGRCELDDGPAIPVETARRLACDASVVKILEDSEGEPLDVGRKTRTIPPSLRRAIRAAFSPAAPTNATWTVTTFIIGRRAARRNCRISSRCAARIIAPCTRAASRSNGSTTAPGAS
jgi:hypothetical protein